MVDKGHFITEGGVWRSIANNSANSVRFRWKNHYFQLSAYTADGKKKPHKGEHTWKKASYKVFESSAEGQTSVLISQVLLDF